jgi:hypothetical protein
MTRRRRAGFRAGAGALVLIVVVAYARDASAMPEFPGKIAAYLNMSCAPTCTLCHATEQGGGEPVTLFGLSMKYGGNLDPTDPDSVGPALESLRVSCKSSPSQQLPDPRPCDSDGDQVPDVDQLAQNRNPNTGDDLCDVGPRYGCGARVARSDADSLSLLAAGAIAALLAHGVRRARRR